MPATPHKSTFKAIFKLLQPTNPLYPAWLMLGGLLGGLVFSYGWSAWLLTVAILPYVWLFIDSSSLSWGEAIGRTIAFFGPFYLVVLKWFIDADVSGLTGISNSVAIRTSAAALIGMSVIWTLASWPLAVLLKLSAGRDRKQRRIDILLLLPAVWVLTEWLRSWIFSIATYGKGGSLGDYWNFGSLGLGLMNTPLRYLSKFGGMYGLTFLLVWLVAFGVWVAKKHRRRSTVVYAISVLGVILLTVVARFTWTGQGGTSKHGSVEQIEYQTPHYLLPSDIQSQNTAPKDLIVLPEYSGVFEPGSEPFAQNYVNKRLSSTGLSIDVDDGPLPIHYGTLEARDYHGKIVAFQTKQLLIPAGEFLPGVISQIYKVSGNTEALNSFHSNRAVHKGQPPRVFKSRDLVIGPVSCSGILGRVIYRNLTRDGAQVLTNSASLLIFNESQAYFRQSLMMARFHAIANSRTFIQASKAAPAFVIDPNGRYIVKPAEIADKFIDFDFSTNSSLTPYAHFGEWVLQASGLLVAGYLFAAYRKRLER